MSSHLAIPTSHATSVHEDFMSPKSMRTVKSMEAFGDAFICQMSNNQVYMLCNFRMSEDEFEEELMAIQTFMSLCHGNLIRVLDKRITGKNCRIALEYHELHLGNFISKLSRTMIKIFLFQIISGVNEYHLKDLIHNDLRPQNILVYEEKGMLKVANYKLGFVSGSIKGNKEMNGCYRAPEILYSYPKITIAVDMWSVGCIFGELLSGKPLFTGNSIIDRVESIHSLLGQPDEDLIADATLRDFLQIFPKKVPKDLYQEFPDLDVDGVDLLSKLLRLNPKERITSDAALQHPYFSELHETSSNALVP